MWEEGIRLENGVDIPFIDRDIINSLSIQKNVTTSRIQETCNDVQDSWFTRTRSPKQGIELTFFQLKVDVF